MLKGQGSGGRVRVYITRPTIEWANAANFNIVVHDENEKEIYREEFEHKTVNRAATWYNFMNAYIPIDIGTFFYVYVIDEVSNDATRYKFRINKQ
jgi:hypothetical protein